MKPSSNHQHTHHTVPLTLSQVLSNPLPIPDHIRKDVAVERALQERQTAANALQCLGANLACLRLAIQDVTADPQTALEIQELLEDIQSNLNLDELELHQALDEI